MPYQTSLTESIGRRPAILAKGLLIIGGLSYVIITSALAYAESNAWIVGANLFCAMMMITLIAFVLYLRERNRNQNLLERQAELGKSEAEELRKMLKAQRDYANGMVGMVSNTKEFKRRNPADVPFEVSTYSDTLRREEQEVIQAPAAAQERRQIGFKVPTSEVSNVRYHRDRNGDWIDTWEGRGY